MSEVIVPEMDGKLIEESADYLLQSQKNDTLTRERIIKTLEHYYRQGMYTGRSQVRQEWIESTLSKLSGVDA